MNISFFGIKYSQGTSEYISTVLPMKYIIENSEVLVYGEDLEYGYQRAPKIEHYRSISRQLLEDFDRSVSPNSIVLGLNVDDLNKIFVIDTDHSFDQKSLIKFSVNKESKLKFRIIDGQHRIFGFKDAIEKSSNHEEKIRLEEFPVNVIIKLVNKDKRISEVYAFSDINSKAKPLKMDLTILATYQYVLKEKIDKEKIDLEKFLATSVIKRLNEGKGCEYWKNGIVIDINSTKRMGCIGFKSFLESLIPICKIKINENNSDLLNIDFIDLCEKLFEIADNLCMDISKYWNVVFEKWPLINPQWLNEGDERILTYYDKKYYLQRTMGALAINNIIVTFMKLDASFELFQELINNCTLTNEDWSISGKFSGISSQSGVKKIVQAICNDSKDGVL